MQDFDGETRRKKQLGRHNSRWENHIRMDSKEIGWKDLHWICVVQDTKNLWAVVNAVTKPSGSIKCREFLKQLRNQQLPKKDSAV